MVGIGIQNSPFPQNTGGSYETCRGLAAIPKDAANLILEASGLEGTDPTLVAVTILVRASPALPITLPMLCTGRGTD